MIDTVKKTDYDYFRFRTQQAIRDLHARVCELEERLGELLETEK